MCASYFSMNSWYRETIFTDNREKVKSCNLVQLYEFDGQAYSVDRGICVKEFIGPVKGFLTVQLPPCTTLRLNVDFLT